MATKQPLPTNPLLGLDLNALMQMQQAQQGGPLRSYAPGFGPQDNLFGEQGAQRQTNNPNATPVGGGGLDPALRRIVEQNMGTGRLDISGNRVDPLAPTGIDWLRDNGGQGQIHSWDQPQYPNLRGNQAVERQRGQDIFRMDNEQSVNDARGQTIRGLYGTATNVPMERNIPEGGSQRLPMAEGANLSQQMNEIFNSQASNPRLGENYRPSAPTSFDLTMPPQMEYHPQNGLPSFDARTLPNFNRGMGPAEPSAPLPNIFAPTQDPGQSQYPATPPLGQTQPQAPPVFASSQMQAPGVQQSNAYTPAPQILELLKNLYMMFTPKAPQGI